MVIKVRLRWFLEKEIVRIGADGSGSRSCPVMGICISGNKFSDSATRVFI
jgi:hypothetical protein